MASETPPPLPRRGEPLWVIYTKAIALIFPAPFFLVFTGGFVVPKTERIWALGGLDRTPLHLVMDIVRTTDTWFLPAMGVMVAIILLLEWKCRPWPSLRSGVVTAFIVLWNFLALFSLTTLAVANATGYEYALIKLEKKLEKAEAQAAAPVETGTGLEEKEPEEQ